MFLQCSLKGETKHTYSGDRAKEDIIGYAVRMAAPPIQHIASFHHLKEVIAQEDLFFVYAGEKEGALWVSLDILLVMMKIFVICLR